VFPAVDGGVGGEGGGGREADGPADLRGAFAGVDAVQVVVDAQKRAVQVSWGRGGYRRAEREPERADPRAVFAATPTLRHALSRLAMVPDGG